MLHGDSTIPVMSQGCAWLCVKWMSRIVPVCSEFLGRRNCCFKERLDKLKERWNSILSGKVGSSLEVDERMHCRPEPRVRPAAQWWKWTKYNFRGSGYIPLRGGKGLGFCSFFRTQHYFAKTNHETTQQQCSVWTWGNTGGQWGVTCPVVSYEEVRVPKHSGHSFLFLSPTTFLLNKRAGDKSGKQDTQFLLLSLLSPV